MIIDFTNTNGGGGSGYTLPVATQSTLGGVKIGDGINVDSAGTISVSGSDVANYAMALKNIQDGDGNHFKVVNKGGWLYYIDDYRVNEENIFVNVMLNTDYVSIDMDIDGQTDTHIMDIFNDAFSFAVSSDDEGKLYYVNENDEDVYYDSEIGEYQYGDFTFEWGNDGKHIEFPQQSNLIEVVVFTDNYEIWYCVGQEMHIANEETLGLVKVGDGLEVAEDGTISVTGGTGGEGIHIYNHLYEAEYERVWLDQYGKAVNVKSVNTIPNGGMLKFYDITKYTGDTVVMGIAGVTVVTTNENNEIFVDGTEIPKMYRSAMNVRTTQSYGSFYMDAIRPQFEDGNHLWFTVNGSANSKLYIYIDTDNKEVYDDADEWTGGAYELDGGYDEETDTYDYTLEFEHSSDVNGYTMAIQNYDHMVNEGLNSDNFMFYDAENGFVFVNETGSDRNVTLIEPIRNDIKDGEEVSIYEHFDDEYQYLGWEDGIYSYGQSFTRQRWEFHNNKMIFDDLLMFYCEYYGKYLYAYATANNGYRFEYWQGAKPNGTQLSANTMTASDSAYTFNFNQVGGSNNSHTFTRTDDGMNFVFNGSIACWNQTFPINSPAHSEVAQYTWTDDPELICDISFNNDFNGTGNGQDKKHFFYIVDYHQFPYGKKLFVHQYYNATDPITFFETDEHKEQINVYTGSTLSAHSETPTLIIYEGSTGSTGKYNHIVYSWKGNEFKFHNFDGSLCKIYDLNTDLTATGWVKTNIEANIYKGYLSINEYEAIDSKGEVVSTGTMNSRNIRINPTSSYGSIGQFYGNSSNDIGPIFAPATTAATADQLCVSAQGWAAPTWKTMLALLGIKAVWRGTEDEYDAIGAGNYDGDTLYIIVEE